MNKQAVKAIIKKDIRAVFSSVQMWLPMVIVPLVIVVAYPLILLIASKMGAMNLTDTKNADYLTRIINIIPAGAVKNDLLSFHTAAQRICYFFLDYSFIPLFLLLPVMTSSIISANSFAGEKEKKTLETLLFSPVSERDLLFAKVMASFIPAVALSIVSAALYGVILDTVGYNFFGRIIFPSFKWIIAVLWLSPAISLLSIFISVFISAKVKGFQEAQQLSVIVILPVIALFVAQIGGLLFLGAAASFVIGLLLFAIDFVLLRFSPRAFNRQKLFMSQI